VLTLYEGSWGKIWHMKNLAYENLAYEKSGIEKSGI